MNLFTKRIPFDTYKAPEDFDQDAALAFPRDNPPAAYLAVMVELQDRIADTSALVANFATAKDHGYLASAAGQLLALQELWDSLEARREAAMKL
jgi:hypothetical protein